MTTNTFDPGRNRATLVYAVGWIRWLSTWFINILYNCNMCLMPSYESQHGEITVRCSDFNETYNCFTPGFRHSEIIFVSRLASDIPRLVLFISSEPIRCWILISDFVSLYNLAVYSSGRGYYEKSTWKKDHISSSGEIRLLSRATRSVAWFFVRLKHITGDTAEIIVKKRLLHY